MDRMVITCFPNGNVEHTLKDSFLNPFPGRERKIERMTEILPTEDGLAFYMVWQRGPFAHMVHTFAIVRQVCSMSGVPTHDIDAKIRSEGLSPQNMVLFNTYEEAVEAEVELINHMRRLGVSFAE